MTEYVLNVGAGAFAVVGTSITLKTRSNLAMPHLCSAARFSRQVGVIEKANKGNSFAVYWDDMRDFATASVVMSAASLECYANELYSDRDQLFSDHDKTVLGKFWEFLRRSRRSKNSTLLSRCEAKPTWTRQALVTNRQLNS